MLKKGDIIKINSGTFRVEEVEPFRYKWTNTSGLAPSGTNKYDVSVLKPEVNQLFEITGIGVEGGVGFSFEYPKGVARETPHNEEVFIYSDLASQYNPIPYRLFIKEGTEPKVSIYNPYSSSISFYIWFFGFQYTLEKTDKQPTKEVTVYG